MNFFDPKEDVIDLKLTQHGKHLMSKGKLIPKYYAFFDDDIIYDIRWVTGSLEERQSDIEDRIQDETPRPRVQHCFHGVETEIKRVNELVRQKKAVLGDEILQPMAAKHYALSAPLGNSSLNTNKMPAWQTSFLNGRLKESVDYATGSSPNIKIPQLDCEIKYVVEAFAEGEERSGIMSTAKVVDPDGSDADTVGMWGGEIEFEDGSTLVVSKDYILLEIEEANTDYLEQNFDIEVYEIRTIPASGSQSPGQNKGEKEQLLPLFFARQNIDLGSVYLTEAPEGSAQSITTVFPDVDPNYVEYYFDLNVDREIRQSVICGNLPKNKTQSGRLQREFRCPDDLASEQERERKRARGSLVDFADGLYDSEQKDLDDFEDCD